ncbi:MAG: HmuY family protein [Gemmatimonadota bacterium]
MGAVAAGAARRKRFPAWLFLLGLAFFLLLIYLVAGSLVRPPLATFAPTPIDPRPAGDSLVVDTVTLDARDPVAWTRFDFSRGSVVSDPGPLEWDIAVRRYRIAVNGGAGSPGRAGAIALDLPWDSVREAAPGGYVGASAPLSGDPSVPALDRWYRYDFLAHTLEPRPRTYVIRTADGEYAKLRILGYYCPEATPGCLTFEYAYQGDGGRRLVR